MSRASRRCVLHILTTPSSLTLFLEKEGKRCKFLPLIGEEEKMLDFRDQILVGGIGSFANKAF